MSDRERRLRTIELTMTPLQVVLLWVSKAGAAETLLDACNQSPPPRQYVANAIGKAVQAGIKGQPGQRQPGQRRPGQLIQQAVDQAQREGDFLYLLVVQANTRVIEQVGSNLDCDRVLAGYVNCVFRMTNAGEELGSLRTEVSSYVENALILDEVVNKQSREYFESSDVLLRQPRELLDLQVKRAQTFLRAYNALAETFKAEFLDMDCIRERFAVRVDEEFVRAISLARATMLAIHRGPEECWAALKPFLSRN
jgi:hypothetical protein